MTDQESPTPDQQSPDRQERRAGPHMALIEWVFRDVLRGQVARSTAGLGLGLVCVLLGLVLLLHGLTGSTGWVVQFLGVNSSLSDAPAGVVLAVFGVLVVWQTGSDFRSEK